MGRPALQSLHISIKYQPLASGLPPHWNANNTPAQWKAETVLWSMPTAIHGDLELQYAYWLPSSGARARFPITATSLVLAKASCNLQDMISIYYHGLPIGQYYRT